jgi:chemotaxis protein CheZ
MNNKLTTQPETMTETALLNRIGQVTRVLHDSLTGLGLEKILEQIASDIPDARDRLGYVARMTEQAAERVLNATDAAIPLQTELAADTAILESRWKEVLANPSLKSEYNRTADETLQYLAKTVAHTTESKALLMDIMMAQDFQDLTGQVIKKVTNLANDMEKQLIQVLLDFSPSAPTKEAIVSSITENDEKNTQEGTDATPANQEQVDDLLESIGF